MRTQFSSYIKAASIVDILPVRSIVTSPFPLREEVGDIDELTRSVGSRGLLEPIIVRPAESKFEIVAGHRRFQACKMNRFSEIPAIVMSLTDKEAYEVSIEENLHRKTLDPFEEAKAFRFYVTKYGYGSTTELANRIGKSEEYVSHRIKLLDLPQDVRELVRRRLLTSSDAWEIARVKDAAEQVELAEAAVTHRLTVKEIRGAANLSIKQLSVEHAVREMHSGDLPNFLTREGEGRRKKTRKAASCVLRIALIRLDDLINSFPEGDPDLRDELFNVRVEIHSVLDRFLRQKLDDGKVKNEISAFIKQVFLNTINSGKISVLSKFKSKQFTRFGDFPPHGLTYRDSANEQERLISKFRRECRCDVEDLKITRVAGGAIATFTFVYDMKLGEQYCNWKSRVTFVFERINDTWVVLHEHWSPYEFQNDGINHLEEVLGHKQSTLGSR